MVLDPMRALGARAAILVATIAVGACAGPVVGRNGPSEEREVSRTWPVDVDFLRSAVVEQFQHASSRRPAPYDEMSVVELDRRPLDWAATYVDPGGFLEPYRRLPASARRPDLLLSTADGGYWLSEYASTAGPAEFSCGFILHLAPVGPNATTVSVFELTPSVRVGRRWAWSAHGPGRVDDIRFVEPTVTDRHHVLAWIDTLVR